MHKIEVRHSAIIINNYNLGDSPRLENFFSIYDKLRHTRFPKACYYDEKNKRMYLPRGIDVYFIEGLFGCNAHLISKCDPYRTVEPIRIKHLPRDDVQKEAIRFILGKDEYSYTKAKSQLSVNLNPGAGKTYLSIAMASYTSLLTMMITSSLDWIDQWKKRILQYTDIKRDEIYIISGSGSIARLLNGMNDITKYKFILASHDTIKSYGDKHGWHKVGELFIILGIAIKIYDEAHLNFDNICKIDFFTNTMKTLYLTATPARSDERENIIYQTSFKNVPAIDLFDEEEDPRSEYIGISYNSHPTAFDINGCKNPYGFDRNNYTNYVVTKPEFYKLIYILMEISRKKNGKTLIYIGTTSAINIVYNWMEYYFPEYRGQIGVFHSLIPKNQKQEQLNKRIILSTTKSCGAAIDIAGLALTIVLAEPFKSEVTARQSLGRTRDRNTFYIEAVDRGFLSIKNYYKAKQPVFSKYATKCTDIVISDRELDERYNKIIADRYNTYMQQIYEYQMHTAQRNVVERIIVERR
jgi:superfamily II DNA or RNA helicase